MMTRTRLLAILLASVFVFWYLFEWIFGMFFGVEYPIIGKIGITPFSWLRAYGVLIGGVFAIIVFMMLDKRRKM